MSQFFLRIANYIANELIVKGLANNRSFQRFALKTADHVDKVCRRLIGWGGVGHEGVWWVDGWVLGLCVCLSLAAVWQDLGGGRGGLSAW